MNNFPPIRLAVLRGLSDLKNNLDALQQDDCPYDNETKLALVELLAPKIIEKVVEKEVLIGAATRGRPSKDVKLSEEDQQMVIDEVKSQLESLNTMSDDDKGLDTNSKIQIAKTKINLLDTLLKMMERHATVAKNEAFKEEVIRILDDLVTEADRETFLARINPLR